MPDVDEAVAFWNAHGTPRLTQRTPEQVARFFDGLDLLAPGVVTCSRWRPEKSAGPDGSAGSGEPGESAASGESGESGEPEEVAMYGGVGRKV